jgi:hypothetical protein
MQRYPFLIININTYISFYIKKKFIKSNIQTYSVFHSILASYSYIYKLGEIGVLRSPPPPPPLKEHRPRVFDLPL